MFLTRNKLAEIKKEIESDIQRKFLYAGTRNDARHGDLEKVAELPGVITAAVDKLIKNERRTMITHYQTKLYQPCPDCQNNAYLTIIEEKEIDGTIIRNEHIVIECDACDYSVSIAETLRGARFLLNLLNELSDAAYD